MIPLLYAGTAGLLFAIGLYGLLTRAGLIHRLLGVNVMATAVFLFLVVLSVRGDGPVDPVPQAMVLTGIVIAVSMTAFALVLVRHLRAMSGSATLDDRP
jgi:multicomponent Na+:H+ antiporter subunit C